MTLTIILKAQHQVSLSMGSPIHSLRARLTVVCFKHGLVSSRSFFLSGSSAVSGLITKDGPLCSSSLRFSAASRHFLPSTSCRCAPTHCYCLNKNEYTYCKVVTTRATRLNFLRSPCHRVTFGRHRCKGGPHGDNRAFGLMENLIYPSSARGLTAKMSLQQSSCGHLF